MKLVVLGANGRTGRHVVRMALDRGDAVTAVVRSEAKRPALRHARLHAVIGDPCDAVFLAGVLRGQDAVVSTLGGPLPTRRATEVYPRSAEAIAEAVAASAVRRVVVTSSALLFPPTHWFERLLLALVPAVVRSAQQMEQIFEDTDLDVTVARCEFLTGAPETDYRALRDALPEDGSSVSRVALARFLVDCARAQWSGHRVFGVSGPGSTGGHSGERPGT